MFASMTRGLIAAALLLVSASPAAAAWRRAETANFILYSQASEAEVREQSALLEDYHGFLRLLTAVEDPPAPNKLRIYLLRGRSQLRTVREVPGNVAGFYTASPSGIGAYIDDKGTAWSGSDDEILFHEIAHHFMMQYRPMAYPAWFVEGFAEYVMTTKIRGRTIDFGQPSAVRASWLSHARWLPFERVLFERPPANPQERALFYAQSWLLAHYMMRDGERRTKFKAYVADINRGIPAREAFAARFGEVKAFGRAVETYAMRHITYSRLTRASATAPPPVRIETLPASADDLLVADAALHVGQRGDYAKALLPRVRAAAAKHPGDPFATRVLAKAEILHGDAARGDALLDSLLAKVPGDVELLYLKGMRHLLAGRADAARRSEHFKLARPWFVKAHKADENNWQVLARYGEALGGDSRFDSDNTLNIALRAQELAPQVPELTMNAANLLILRGRYEEAEKLALPLASNPHNDGLAAAAQALVERARRRGAPGSAAAAKPAGE